MYGGGQERGTTECLQLSVKKETLTDLSWYQAEFQTCAVGDFIKTDVIMSEKSSQIQYKISKACDLTTVSVSRLAMKNKIY